MKEFQILLENFWILRKDNTDLYFDIKDSLEEMKNFVEENLGWNIVKNKVIVKIEKIPDTPEIWMGIDEFSSTEEYVIFSLLLAFLEEKSQGEQFVLSEAAEFILLNYPQSGYINWNSYSLRKTFVKILKFMNKTGLLNLEKGDERGFENNEKEDVLYHSTGISGYFMRQNFHEINIDGDFEKIGKREWLEAEEDKGVLKRQRIYNNLILKPAIYGDDIKDEDFLYIKNFANKISDEIHKYMDSDFHLTKNCAMVLIENDYNFKDTFPQQKSIDDIVLLLNTEIINMADNGFLKIDRYDNIIMEEKDFFEIIEKTAQKYSEKWSKEYREKNIKEIQKEVTAYMKNFMMIDKKEEKIVIKPLTALYKAVYNDNTEGGK